MAGMDDILKALPIDQIAAQLGVDPSEARRAVEEGGATILTGLQRNAQTPEGAAALEKALGQHGSEVSGGTVDLNAVDTADGQKILGHIFGGQEQAVAAEAHRRAEDGGDRLRQAPADPRADHHGTHRQPAEGQGADPGRAV